MENTWVQIWSLLRLLGVILPLACVLSEYCPSLGRRGEQLKAGGEAYVFHTVTPFTPILISRLQLSPLLNSPAHLIVQEKNYFSLHYRPRKTWWRKPDNKVIASYGWVLFFIFKSRLWTLGNSILDPNLVAVGLSPTARIGGKHWIKKTPLQAYKEYSRHCISQTKYRYFSWKHLL